MKRLPVKHVYHVRWRWIETYYELPGLGDSGPVSHRRAQEYFTACETNERITDLRIERETTRVTRVSAAKGGKYAAG